MFIRNIEDISPPIKTYKCFSPNLAIFLTNNNILPVYKYIYNNSSIKKYVWVYIMCDDLSKVLKQWTDNKPQPKNVEGGEGNE